MAMKIAYRPIKRGLFGTATVVSTGTSAITFFAMRSIIAPHGLENMIL
jgi:hypothetical protein